MVQSGDTSLTTWRCSVLIAGLRAAFLRIRLLEVNINPAETKLLYPLRSPRPTADETAYEFTNELEFFAGDQVRIEMFTLASGAAPEYVLSFGYELIPNRRSSQQGVPFTATVI